MENAQKTAFALKSCFLAGMLVWHFSLLVWLPWQGVSRNTDEQSSYDSGSFGITEMNAPIWDPPRPIGSLKYTVKMPWELHQPHYRYFIVVDWLRLAIRSMAAILILGSISAGICRCMLGAAHDKLIDAIWWLALGQGVGLAAIAIFMFSPLAMASDVVPVAPIGFFGGLLLSASLFVLERRLRSRRRRPVAEPSSNQLSQMASESPASFIPAPGTFTVRAAFSVIPLTLFVQWGLPALFDNQSYYLIFEAILLGLGILAGLAPIAMLKCPERYRWLIWTSCYMFMFAATNHGTNIWQGAFMAAGCALAVLGGLIVILWRTKRTLNYRDVAGSPGSLSLTIPGFFAGLGLVLAIAIYLLRPLGDQFRGDVVGSFHGVFAVSEYDDQVNLALAYSQAILGLISIRLFLLVRIVGFRKGFWFGCFFWSTAMGVLWACWH